MTSPVEDEDPMTRPNATPPHPAGGGAVARDGSGTLVCGCESQLLFGGIVPTNGYLVCNNSPHQLFVSDVGDAIAGTGIQIPPNTTFVTPPGYVPQQAVSLYGPTTGQRFAARRW